MIRIATIDDLKRMTEIYNQAIRSKKATADTDEFTVEQRKSWYDSHSGERNPIYVFEENGDVIGYCYLSAYRPGRKALESVAEISYYIDSNHHRKGVGGKLVEHTIQEAKRLGYKNLIAILLDANTGSLALLKKYGFAHWGTLPDIVYLDDHIYSHYYYGLNLIQGLK